LTKHGRSPVLGYNHNLRYGGRTFHVQTEDSGQGYARVYTHLFYQGTILSSKKEEYDPAAPEDAVRAAMQKLHKAMIRELTHQEHDARISAFFIARGEPAMLASPSAPVLVEVAAPVQVAPAPVAPGDSMAPMAPMAPEPIVFDPASVGQELPPLAAVAPAPMPPKMMPKPVVVVQPTVLKRSPVQVSNPADGVVVRRNVVINVGAGQPPVKGTINPAPPSAAGPPTRPRAGAHYAVRDGGGFVAGNRARSADGQSQPLASSREIRMPWETPGPTRMSQPVAVPAGAQPVADAPVTANSGKIRMPWDPPAPGTGEAFSGGLVSDKSLDEVILEYLADDGETEDR
jgi:hypothetical protein